MKKYIKANTNKEETFVRFGKRFKHGKSINYLAMNPRIKEEYSYKLAELQYGYIDEDEFNKWCEEALEDFVWEPNTSCFYCNPRNNLPIVENISQVKTLIGFIQRFEANLPCEAFLVKGIQTGVGTDQEPLVNVTQEEPITYKTRDLIKTVIQAMIDGFKIHIISEDDYSDEFDYCGGGAFIYKNHKFLYPKSSFITNWEYKGQVMDKFKFEHEVDIDPDDIQAIYVPVDRNDGREGIEDAISDWGCNIYEKTYYYENRYLVAIDIKKNGDLYVCGSDDAIWSFTNSFSIDYDEIEPSESLLEKYKSMKFYE